MVFDRALSNGPACISAEWLHELIAMEVEGYAPNELLSITAFAPLSPPPIRPPPTIAEVDAGQVCAPRSMEAMDGAVLM